MELLVVTFAHTIPARDADGLARIHLISDTVRNAPGLVNARFYHSRGPETYYLMLTTWEDEECWQKAQEQYNPRYLLQESTGESLSAPPEQWLMSYLWGYSRPSASPALAAAQLATAYIQQAEALQRRWIESLRRQAARPTMAFAFLARSLPGDRSRLIDHIPTTTHIITFLNLVSWPGEAAREDFYADSHYKTMHGYLSSTSEVRVLELEPL